MAHVPPPFKPSTQPTSFYRSVLYAWSGLIHTVVHQRNMRMHIISAILVGLVGSGIPLGLAEKVTLIFCVVMILFAEMLNSALEQLVDLAIQQFDEKARLTKDIAAAGVLVLAIGTVVIFAAVLVHNADTIFANVPAIRRQVLWGVPLTFCGGALMHEAKKPIAVDVLFAGGALALWVGTLSWTESQVFSAMTLGMLIVCISAAASRQLERRRASAGQAPEKQNPA
ncbi:MAG: diacylglycerol kinase family protein [Myxococcota bacterium]